ncbi:LacI family DNA-binding transcriptional regulator [Microbacterium sp. YY-01]|uniref:LacI family DNA-binding transcriptional regulator n=1 Tax=Microbacterium sp. YY-01 TaxID=3421634 RepID=UPI003D173534
MAASIRDVAVAAGVSVGTVSNVLNRPERVAPATIKRVQSAITSLGFVRNDAARQLRAGRSRSIGLIVLDAGNPFFTEVARGAEDRAEHDNLVVLIGNSDESGAREANYVELFLEQRVNGVLITPASDNLEPLERLRATGTAVVLVDHEAADSGFASVAVDDIEGGYLAASHLLETGRRKLAFVGGPNTIAQVRNRLAGAQRAVDEIADATLEIITTPALTVMAGREAGEHIVARAAADRPDAVFAANDLLAVGVLQAFSLFNNIRVPEDIALIGYDDIDFAAATVVPLSSIRQPAAEIGRTAVDLLLRIVDGDTGPGPHQVRFRPELIVRASTVGDRGAQ